MKSVFFYFLQSVLASGILYGYYHFALRNKKFHQYNRFYLLGSVIISILVPFLNIPLYFEEREIHSSVVLQTLQTISSPVAERENVTPQIISTGTTPTPFNWNVVLYGLYLLAIAILFLRILISLRKISVIIKNNPVEHVGGINFVNTAEPGTPFSFFSWLFWNKQIEIRSDKGKQIFRHELFHIRQKHSLDILFMEAITAIFWINPFFHLMKKEQKAIHEFLADQFALRKTDKWTYTELLLMQALNTQQRLVNPFFHNQIKRRIAMITNPKKTSHRYLRKLLVLPVIAAVVTLFAFKYKNKNHEPVIRANETVTIVVDAGHGGIDPGMKSVGSKTSEAALNLELAKTIQTLANEYNINVVMTREDDQLPGGATSINQGLINRLAIINNVNPTALVTVHVNNALDHGGNLLFIGFEPSIKKKWDSQALDSLTLKEMSRVYFSGMDEKQRKETALFLINRSLKPTNILECGYMNNPADIAFVTQSNNLEKIARAILSGIVKYSDSESNFERSMPNDTVPGIKVLHTTSAPAKRSPTAADLNKWMDGKMYGVWLDEKRINNTDLAKFKPGDFSYYFVSKLEKNATNYGKHYYQVDLMTYDYYKKAYSNPNYLMWERVPGDSSKPLIVIDGKVRPLLALRSVDKEISAIDIESINVLKGAAATKKYGDAGKNGVIEIYTGKSKKVIQFDANGIGGNKVFEKVEIEPSFPGGENAWMKYVERNLNPDVPIINDAPEGEYTVAIEFIVRTDGSVTNVKALTSKSFGMEQEAFGLVAASPKWVPAVQNGVKVSAYKKVLMTFVVTNNNKPTGRGSTPSNPVVIGFKKTPAATEPVYKEVTIGGQDCKVLDKVEIEAAFPGGDAAWKKYLEKNLNASVATQNNAPVGDYTVYIQFTVYCDGYIGEVKPLTNHGFGMEQEAMRMIEKGPKWVPAILNGQKVGSIKKVRFDFVVSNKVSTNTSQKHSSNEAGSAYKADAPYNTKISVSELKKTNPTELMGLPPEAVLSSFVFTIDTDKDVASIPNTGKDFNEAIVKLISNTSAGHMMTIEDVKVVWNGKSQKIPARFWYINN